jgi:hypothetical protein
VSIWRESSARALVCEIVLDWFKVAIFAVPTPISMSSGTLAAASLTDFGMLPLTLRPIRFVEVDETVEEEAPLFFAPPFDPHETAAKAARRHTHTKKFLFIFNSLQKNI